jgi:predicted SAM-dependent methyltransferase
MKINVCSGRHVLDGWTNVDAVVSNHPKARGKKPEILADMRSIPLPDGCADELMCIHGIEHVLPWEAEDAVREWHRLLKVGGTLVIECPDLIKCCKNVISGYKVKDKHPDQMGLWGLYGDNTLRDPFMMHRYAYSPSSMTKLLERNGFTKIRSEHPQWHGAGARMRDMRVTARKA